MNINRVILMVLDGVGIGAQPDADQYFQRGEDGKPVSDKSAATLQNLAMKVGGFDLPNFERMGLGSILNFVKGEGIANMRPTYSPICFYGKALEASGAKDTVFLHWEMMGIISKGAALFPDGFPDEVIGAIINADYREETKNLGITPETCKCLTDDYKLKGIIEKANIPISGTDVIKLYHKPHAETGKLIVYTSADSVLQVAASEEILPPKLLNAICAKIRNLLGSNTELGKKYGVARIISRPYTGNDHEHLERTSNRHDFPLAPPEPTLVDRLHEAGIPTIGIGKVASLFDNRGFSVVDEKGKDSNIELMGRTLSAMDKYKQGLIFSNLLHFDQSYGHRRDSVGFYRALREVDAMLPIFFERIGMNDLLIITADHGNDPTYVGSDHTREYVPLFVFHPQVNGLFSYHDPNGSCRMTYTSIDRMANLKTRTSEADIGQTIAEALLGTPCLQNGQSFYRQMKKALG
ncbi:phosphopentomutase [Candidatus Woesearchaeota archaeon]|nr:phosphopentomutase [Candidatus Woesearchaeota archaeon]